MAFTEKIPRIIHYCWFGKGEKPIIVKKCIDSWKENLAGYEIIEWNEDNFDINCNLYVKEAYEYKKFAFVSDYVRVYALYKFGGIYLDTDVEVFKSFDDMLHHDSFWGFEQENYIATSTIGATKGNVLIKMFLDSYEEKSFIKEDGKYDSLTNVAIISEILKNKGLQLNGKYQEISGIGAFYPQTYFSPYDYINCRKFITPNTYAMHHFYKSWLPPKARLKSGLKLLASKVIGGENIARIRKFVTKN
ncbi:capsular polysaccharide synthesis protein [Bacillus mycoides]|uniref:Glycosyl transferase n=1 Tax=Bacillus mycoides TaxID=1405 RepID=A0A1S9T8H4_BACMY|nr:MULTISPECIES: capsular polysaccharide synthesis protein [Bacillus]MDI6530310.1 capsular polysaccharide synthesis protein [Bacillus mycoides]MED1057852.1 capsular polysaccharide synthesis protein [Bacillus mycoides]OOR06326.1 glycosyl transferase [Bacillus mycoides]PQZ55507.1 glycosyl transferase [Bacillus sp. MYb209]RAN73051.1 glycosyl transferase [Bacillus sp. SRB_8]